jgi:hypothetical protein
MVLFKGCAENLDTFNTCLPGSDIGGILMDLIIGGGKYGCHAVELLRSKGKDFVVVDVDPECQAVKQFSLKKVADAPSEGEALIVGDLPKALELIETVQPEYVFPTAPVHIAANLAKIKFKLEPWLEAVNCILAKLPQSVVLSAGHGNIVASFNRDSHCIEMCTMPETCPTSHVKKPCTMTRLMEYAAPEACILISHSMAPGMGALKGAELRSFFVWAEKQREFVVGTACDCHGVFTTFRKVAP